MTGYESKRAAAQDKLAQPEQEALKLALEALKEIARHATTPWEDEWCGELANETLKAINALAQPAQEPVAKYCCHVCFNKSGQTFLDRMIICSECGNKRCPKATNHALPCTDSNEPNQAGSVFTNTPQPAQEPVCPTCKAGVLYECVACSSNNYPQKPAQEPVAWLEPEWGEQICPEVGYEVTMTDDHPKDLGWTPLYAHPPQGEIVAYLVLFEGAGKLLEFKKGNYIHGAKVEHVPLYTAPPQRTWVGLTDDEIEDLFQSAADADEETHLRFARAIETALRSKNNG